LATLGVDEFCWRRRSTWHEAKRGGEPFPDPGLAVILGTSPGLSVDKPALCSTVVLEFLTKEPAQTLAPIRRA
jgi:hypothetical protein